MHCFEFLFGGNFAHNKPPKGPLIVTRMNRIRLIWQVLNPLSDLIEPLLGKIYLHLGFGPAFLVYFFNVYHIDFLLCQIRRDKGVTVLSALLRDLTEFISALLGINKSHFGRVHEKCVLVQIPSHHVILFLLAQATSIVRKRPSHIAKLLEFRLKIQMLPLPLISGLLDLLGEEASRTLLFGVRVQKHVDLFCAFGVFEFWVIEDTTVEILQDLIDFNRVILKLLSFTRSFGSIFLLIVTDQLDNFFTQLHLLFLWPLLISLNWSGSFSRWHDDRARTRRTWLMVVKIISSNVLHDSPILLYYK